jgi:hypothetical protein
MPAPVGTRRTGRNTLWRCYIPEEIAAQIELRLADPLRDKPTYGARSQLVTALLIRYLAELNQTNQEQPK